MGYPGALIREGKRFCTYCRCNKPEKDFKIVRDPKKGRKTNMKCTDCCSKKRLSVAERDARGAQIRDSRRAYQARKLLENIRRRNESQADPQ